MSPDRVRGAVVVLRAKSTGAVPSWLRDEEASERLRDGSFVVPAGLHRVGDLHYAVKCIVEAIEGDLSFHDDARGLRWLRFGPIANKPIVEGQAPGFGRFTGFDLDYEQCVGAVGVWVPLASVEARRAALAKASAAREASSAVTLSRVADQTPDLVNPSDTVQHKNVVVVRGAPRSLPKEFVVLVRMPDGTVLGVGPRHRGWVDWLKKNVPLEALRLLRGPVSDTFLKEMLSFEMLDAACRLQGQPLLIMKPAEPGG